MPREFTTPVLLPAAAPTDPRHATSKSYVDVVAAPVTFVDTSQDYTAKPGEYVLANAASGPITITLSTGTSGVKKVDASTNLVSVQAASGNTIGSLGASVFPLRLTDQALVATVRGTNHAITHGYQSLQQIDRRYARSPVPTSAGGRAGTYSPAKNVYTPPAGAGALRPIRGFLARATVPAASAALVDFVCLGDSRVAGSNIPGATPVTSWPSQLRARLTAAGFNVAGTGLVMASSGGALDARIVLAGSWSPQYPYRQWGATGATATFTSDVPGTVVEVYYYATSGTFTVKVDSAAAVTVTPSGSMTIAKYTVSGLSNATHTVVVNSTSASGFLIGFCVRNTSGVLVHTVGYGGSTSTSLATTGPVTLQGITSFINPSILGVMVGANDPPLSVSAATHAANLATITTTNNPNAAKFLVLETPPSSALAAWPDYVAAQYDTADQLGCPLLDLNDRFVSPTLGNAAGLLATDLLHETVAGGFDVARGVAELLAA